MKIINSIFKMTSFEITDKKSRDIIESVFNNLPEKQEDVDKDFVNITPALIKELSEGNMIRSVTINSSLEKPELFESVLIALDKLKNKLGGSLNFSSTPTIEIEDNLKTFFGIPMSAVKDWFRMTLVKCWKPQIFWKSIAKLFNVTQNNLFSQYEEAYISIQRFKLLIANKERFFHILDFKQEERYEELITITGLAWHPHSNGCGTEKTYIEFVEKFLTEYFEAAEQQGEEALLEYFNAFSGVCFESRARALEAYAVTHPLASDLKIDIPSDWDTLQPAEHAFMKETQALYEQIKEAPNTNQLLKHLESKGIFDLEFSTSTGTEKVKPTKEQFYSWAKKQVEECVLSE